MVPGYNHNIPYKGRTFHVQTEDSGLTRPHIITHVYFGGTIVASYKSEYADIVSEQNVRALVEQRMKDQHKQLMKNLLSGLYDDVIRERVG